MVQKQEEYPASTGGTVVERGYSNPGCVGLSLGHITLFSSFLIPFCVTIFSKFFLKKIVTN